MHPVTNHNELLKSLRVLEKELKRVNDLKKLDEVFTLQRWLNNCAPDIFLPYPGTIVLAEKSDFRFYGTSIVGIEVTKFLAEQRRRAEVLANEMGVAHYPTLFDFDSPKRRNPDIDNLIVCPPSGLASWRETGPSLMMYSKRILQIIAQKTSKVITHANEPCDYNILVIEDWHQIPDWEKKDLVRMLKGPMTAVFQKTHSFKEVWFTSLSGSCKAIKWIQ
jgi:hypothetical protein